MDILTASLPDELVNKILLYVSSNTSKIMKEYIKNVYEFDWTDDCETVYEWFSLVYGECDELNIKHIILLGVNQLFGHKIMNMKRLKSEQDLECDDCEDRLDSKEISNYKWCKNIYLCRDCFVELKNKYPSTCDCCNKVLTEKEFRNYKWSKTIYLCKECHIEKKKNTTYKKVKRIKP